MWWGTFGLRVLGLAHKLTIGTIYSLSSFGERVGVRGSMRLCWSFRSLLVPCFSLDPATVNVPGRLNRRRPGDPVSRQENRRFAIPSSYSLRLRVGRDPASMQVTPSPRIAPAFSQRLSDLQPDKSVASIFEFPYIHSLLTKRRKTKTATRRLPFCCYLAAAFSSPTSPIFR